MMKKLLLISLILFNVSFLKAQDMIFSLDYNFGRGIGDMEEYIPDQAYRGGGLNYTKFLDGNEHIGIGVSIDWQGFYKKMQRESFAFYDVNTSTTTSDVNAVQFRYMYTTPIYVGLDYYFVKDATILPYIGINVGTIYTEQELYISAFDNEINTAWDFAYGAEAGIHMAFGESGVGLNVIAKYNLSTYNYTFQNINFETGIGSYLSVGVGISFLMLNYY